MNKRDMIKLLSKAGFTDGKDYWFITSAWDEIMPYSDKIGHNMAIAINKANIHPKAEAYYSDTDNEVLICGYAR